MNRIDSVFSSSRCKALVAYVTAGFPSIERTLEIIPKLASLGCDIIEIGIPFSDPLADGVTIQEASYSALKKGVTLESCLDMVRYLRRRIEVPLVFMSYFNPILSYGTKRFALRSGQIGLDGVIIPDLPPEEGTELQDYLNQHGVHTIYLLSPNNTAKRISAVARQSGGFIYLVSLTGVTGVRTRLPAGLENFVASVRKYTSKPLCVGFGISTPEETARVARIADGVIVGSRLVQLLAGDSLKSLAGFVKSLRQALDNPGLCK
ncbi:MAG: tryptophan synthase subunit alpha [Chloroflexota bacterium]